MVCLLGDYNYASHTIHLLCELGADVDTRKNNGDGVLHLLPMNSDGVDRGAKANLMLELGEHFDMGNNEGKTATLASNVGNVDSIPDWQKERVPNLKCLSSKVIRRATPNSLQG